MIYVRISLKRCVLLALCGRVGASGDGGLHLANLSGTGKVHSEPHGWILSAVKRIDNRSRWVVVDHGRDHVRRHDPEARKAWLSDSQETFGQNLVRRAHEAS